MSDVSKQTTTDIVLRLRDMPSIPERRDKMRDEAADEIERLRALILEIMAAPEAAYHGDWFARATETLPRQEQVND